MKKFLLISGISLAVVLLVGLSIVLWGLGTYNGFIKQEQTTSNSWATVETQYQRRFDLIPGLVNATKGFLKQEQSVFGAIAEARTKYAGTKSGTEERVAATNQIETALSRLLVIMENYPELKSNQTIQALMDELAGTENRIQVARERYNAQVQIWNTNIKTIPANFIAVLFGFKEKTFFESTTGAEQAVPVNL